MSSFRSEHRTRPLLESRSVPKGFEALADALLVGGDVAGACHEIGRWSAAEGLSLDEVFGGISRTTHVVGRGEPTFEAARSAALAWAEASLRFQHGISCDDPLTGLSSIPHLRSQLAAAYRAAERTGAPLGSTHALVVVDIHDQAGEQGQFGPSLRLLELAGVMRRVYSGDEVLARLSASRIAALTHRDQRFGEQTMVLTALVEEWARGRTGGAGHEMHPRVWVEGLPRRNDAAGVVLDELAR
jgi:hypothetical protein